MTPATSLLRTAGFAALYLATTWLGRQTIMDGTNLSLVWPAAGVSAVWFLVQWRSRWRACDALALAGVTLVVNTATGAPPVLALMYVAANLVQAGVFVYLFRRWLPHLWGGGGDQPLARLAELWRLIGSAFLASAAGALIGPTAGWVVHGVHSWPATAVWQTRNTVSILLIGAVGLRLGHLVHRMRAGPATGVWTRVRSRLATLTWPRACEYVAVVVVSAFTYFIAFGADHGLPLAFPLLAMTVWAAVRLRTGFVVLHDLVFGSVAVLYTLHGDGPFAHVGDNAGRALIAQAFVGMVAIVGLSLALGRDERSRLLADLRASERAAADQAATLGTIVDGMAEGLAVLDEQGKLILRNPAGVQLLGGAVSKTGRIADSEFYGLFHPDGTPVDAADLPFRRALLTGEPHSMDIVVRNAQVPDGRVLHVTATRLPHLIDGRPCALSIFSDVTAERRHRDELASFAGVVAHDLLNPLATVQGWSDAALVALEDAPAHDAVEDAVDGLQRVRRAGARMRNLINDLLAYTTARDAALAPADVSLTALVSEIATARADQAESAGGPVPRFHVEDLPGVHADPVLIRQVLDNLISNAVKYVAPGVTPELGISAADAGNDYVEVRVVDNGIGIPAGQHGRVFDNFHRAHRTAGYVGTGLGLGICRRIVERHGGTIVAEPGPGGRGTCIRFTVPASVAVSAHRHATSPG
ncbi:ATP-binding protein [Couchioplanes caeruleus]|uniref:Sensor-like histidine kinase SenX3 n=2 Tax=Couchioplanes caeruleus TaxID=56438 RepID=A0A1K0FNE5_9ACTN|nr:ATP-binding protein [Couchioplanes caeruleus]OJF14232.1 histidine kinase [Couchioplanes caeruleus subsp. caeruleus]ROP27966.1 phospho-acceptor domain-containing protein [Couchioplanes caeruleus]